MTDAPQHFVVSFHSVYFYSESHLVHQCLFQVQSHVDRQYSRCALWRTFHFAILPSTACRTGSRCTTSIFVRPASIPHPVHVSAFPQPLWITPTASTVLLSLPLVYPLPMQLADSPSISVPCASVTFHGTTRDLTK